MNDHLNQYLVHSGTAYSPTAIPLDQNGMPLLLTNQPAATEQPSYVILPQPVGSSLTFESNRFGTPLGTAAGWTPFPTAEPYIPTPAVGDLQLQIAQMQQSLSASQRALSTERSGRQASVKEVEEIREKLAALTGKQQLSHLLSRVNERAQQQLLESETFRQEFAGDKTCDAYVVSIDIRRSTELMLKARAAKLYAEFIISLARGLREIVLSQYGVFDKFTGDGVLAFFPDFYSGEDAGFLALQAASRCHDFFANHYRAHRHCFQSVLKDTGLGIGIDQGRVQFAQFGGEFTVVGTPVVYACRMGGANPGCTFVNQPAYEELSKLYSDYCTFQEVDLVIKHEGPTVAYAVKMTGKAGDAKTPMWEQHPAQTSKAGNGPPANAAVAEGQVAPPSEQAPSPARPAKQ